MSAAARLFLLRLTLQGPHCGLDEAVDMCELHIAATAGSEERWARVNASLDDVDRALTMRWECCAS